MIDRAVLFLKDRLNEQFTLRGDGSSEDRVQFPEGDKLEPLTLRIGAINLMIVNITQERVLRGADPYSRVSGDGSRMVTHPDLRIELWLLFAARFKIYEDGLTALSTVLRYFQRNSVFEPAGAPDLDPRISRLNVELRTQNFNEQNDLWGALRIAYHPSLLYKVGLLVFQDDGLPPAGGRVVDTQRELQSAG